MLKETLKHFWPNFFLLFLFLPGIEETIAIWMLFVDYLLVETFSDYGRDNNMLLLTLSGLISVVLAFVYCRVGNWLLALFCILIMFPFYYYFIGVLVGELHLTDKKERFFLPSMIFCITVMLLRLFRYSRLQKIETKKAADE